MFTALFIIQDSDLLVNLRQACESVRRGNGENFTARLFSTAETEADAALAEEFFECAKRADFIYIELHGGTPYFPHFARLEREYLRKVPFFLRSGLDDENAVIQKISPLPQNIYARLLRYHMAGGLENCLNLVRCIPLRGSKSASASQYFRKQRESTDSLRGSPKKNTLTKLRLTGEP